MEKISVIVITKNEESNLRRCLDSVKDFSEIIIVDSGSTDNTLNIAREYTSKVFERKLDNFSNQKNFATNKCTNDWVLSLDADEVVSKKLKDKISALQPDIASAYRIKRNTYLFGRLMKYGGHSSDAPIRLFDKKNGKFVQPIHEFVKIGGGWVELIEEPIIHRSSNNINEYVQKLNLYTDLEVQFLLKKNAKFSYIKTIFYPIIKFINRYVFKKGFLDGKEGFIFYALSVFYDFLRWFKLWENLKFRRCL